MIIKENRSDSMITRAMDMLELLSIHPEGLSLQQIVEMQGYPKSSTYKIANNLYILGYLGKEPDTLKYFLTRKLLTIGMAAGSSHSIMERSLSAVNELRDKTGESVMVGIPHGLDAVLFHESTGTNSIVVSFKQGMTFSYCFTAAGKVMLAYLPKEQQDAIIDKEKEYALKDYKVIDKFRTMLELELVRRDGFSVDINECVTGISCVAAPIFGESDQLIAALWVSAPSGRLTQNQIPQIVQQVVECAALISQNLGKHNL